MVGRLAAAIQEKRANHRARHTPTGFEFALSDRIGLLDAASWDRVTVDSSYFLSREYLRVLDEHGLEGVCQRYALIADHGRPVAAVAAQVVEVRGSQVVAGHRAASDAELPGTRASIKAPARRLAAKAVSLVNARVLVCGNLASWGFDGIAFAPGEDAARLWPAVAEALFRLRIAAKLAGKVDIIVVKDITPTFADGAVALRTFSYRPLETEPDMVLEINPAWRTFEDYLGSLTGKYRKSAREVMRDALAAGVTFERVGDLRPIAPELHALYRQVQGNAAVKLVTMSPAYLPELAAAAGDRFRAVLAKREGRIAGFVTFLKDRETGIGYTIGFDREVAKEAPLYLALLQSVVQAAIETGCRRLSLGRTALEPKARIGARPVPMTVWLRHRVPFTNLVMRSLLGGIHHDEAPERNPFKAAGGEA